MSDRVVRFVLDGREWRGGIGRFARETTPYLPAHDTVRSRRRPSHPLAPLELAFRLRSAGRPFFSHGYMPPLRSPVPTIVTLHDLMYLPGHTAASRPRAAYMTMMKPLLRRCAAIVTMSEAARVQAIDWLGEGVPVVAVGGGVSSDFSPPSDEHRRPDPATVLYVGSRAPNKNIPGVLRGFAHSHEAQRLLLTGGAADWAGPMQDAGVDLGDRVAFLDDVAETSLPDVYRRASVLLMPSIEEGYGLPALEAMATGVPVIYGRDAAMQEIVGDAGLSVDPYDHVAIGQAVDALIADPFRARALGEIGCVRAAERRWPDVADRIADLIASAS